MNYFVIQCNKLFWTSRGWSDRLDLATKYLTRKKAAKIVREIIKTEKHLDWKTKKNYAVSVKEVTVTYSLEEQQTYIGGQKQNAI